MLRRVRVLAALTTIFLVVGASPAVADDGEETFRINGKFLILFAEGFDATEGDLIALRELGLGHGDLFKLNLYSTVLGVPIEQLLAGATLDEDGEYDFAWGELKKTLTDEQIALLDELPRNFGQMVSAEKRHHGRDAHQPDHAGRGGDKPDKPGKPPHPHSGGGDGDGGGEA